MQYLEVDSSRVDELIKEIFCPVITEKLTKKTALKLYPQVTSDIARRTGMVEALVHLDLFDDDTHENAKGYLESELYKLSNALKVGKFFK